MAINFNEAFASVKEMVNGLVDNAAKTANNLSTQAKANMSIHTEQEKIKKAQLELGTLIYNAISSGEAADKSAVEEICKRIDDSYAVINEMKETLDALRAAAANEAEIAPDAINGEDLEESGEGAGTETPAAETALVIMAAGIGSRFGAGIKQLTPVGPGGEMIIDYSIHDALEAGFNKVCFIVREEIEPIMREMVGDRIASIIGEENVIYVHQKLNALPSGYDGDALAANRKKPWGTGQAVLSCWNVITCPFAVINADDYYGKKAFKLVHDYLVAHAGDKGHHCMAGFVLKNTLSDFGSVTRGICSVDENGYMTDVVETFDIVKTETGAESRGGVPADPEALTSMNMWGFTPEFLDSLESGFRRFLETGELTKGEYLLPGVVGEQLKQGEITVQCLRTDDSWFGVTYAEDKPLVEEAIRNLIAEGKYPEKLWQKG